MKKVPFGEFHHQNPIINAVIEVPAGSRHKFSYSQDHEAHFLTKTLGDDLTFPFNYGFVPKTLSGDGDHLDVFIISGHPFPSHSVVPSRPIGLIEIMDRGKRDNKIVAVPVGEKEFENIETWEDLSEEIKNRLKDFYKNYSKQLEHNLEVLGFHGKLNAIDELRLTQILD